MFLLKLSLFLWCSWLIIWVEYFKNYKLSLKIKDNVLSAYLENKLVLEYEDQNNLLDSGAMGLIVEDGTLVTDEIVVG